MEGRGQLELRKLPPKSRSELCQIISNNDQWKTVMAHIPRSTEDPTNKYTTDHVNIIEKHSLQTGKLAMDILLEEWGTSGRKRPTVQDLHDLCQGLELFRAADFISEELLEGNNQCNDSGTSSNNLEEAKIKEYNTEIHHAGYINLPVNKSNKDGTNFKLSEYANMNSDELHKQLDSLIIDSKSQEQPSPNEELPSLLESVPTSLPEFAYSFLQTITNNFSDVSHDQGGNKLGAGAFGSVYYGRLSGQLGLQNKAIAVKRLSRNTNKVDEQFSNEVNMMALISHPNLLDLLAYSSGGEYLCLLYPFMENGSVEECLAVKNQKIPPLTPMNRLRIAYGTALGLQYLHNASHTKPLIHRDVKTANILLGKDLEPKIGDFGLVRLGGAVREDSGQHETLLTSVAVGTSAYMAPEAIRGEISTKMDIYSFGVVILELLTGLPVMDLARENRDLVSHVEEMIDDDSAEIEDCLDKKFSMMEWRQVSPKQLYLVAKACLEKKKNRPYINEVVDLVFACFH